MSKDVIFRFCCRLFGNITTTLSSESGNCDWRHISELLSEHEKSSRHMKAFQSWIECSKRQQLGITVDSENQRIIDSEAERWKEVLKRIVYMIEFLASQNLALRGKTDKLYARDNGNLLKILEFVGKFDVIIAEHLRRIASKETFVHYVGKNIQNEIIGLLGLKIKQHILQEVQKWTYFSIRLDCTPDVSHTEQLSLIVRYVTCEPGEEPCIQERFLGFIPVESSTGEALTATLLNQLEDLKLPLGNMRGQGYDNGANMKGKHAGVQKRILSLNPRACFVPCSVHSLNLVVNDAALSCIEAVNFFSTIQEVCYIFSASTYRWSVLKKHVTSLTLKPLSETRWESRIDAIKPLRYQAGEVYDALFELATDSRTDAFGKNTALSLAKKIKNFKFICCLLLWHSVLFRINVISKLLQKQHLDISKAAELTNNVKAYFEEMRSDKGFEMIRVDAREVAETLEIGPSFERESRLRPRTIKRQFDYESSDEPYLDPKDAFKRNFYFYVLDRTISSLEERFTQLNQHHDIFGLMYDIERNDKEGLTKKCADLQIALTDGSHSDIDGFQLYQELLVIKSILPTDNLKEPVGILKYLTSSSLSENFPNLYTALRIPLTLPVSVASGERSFSKLKLIKNYLRSPMSQERLVGLSLISIEYQILQKINIDQTIKDFAEQKARKVLL